jgi:hypothetical protein
MTVAAGWGTANAMTSKDVAGQAAQCCAHPLGQLRRPQRSPRPQLCHRSSRTRRGILAAAARERRDQPGKNHDGTNPQWTRSACASRRAGRRAPQAAAGTPTRANVSTLGVSRRSGEAERTGVPLLLAPSKTRIKSQHASVSWLRTSSLRAVVRKCAEARGAKHARDLVAGRRADLPAALHTASAHSQTRLRHSPRLCRPAAHLLLYCAPGGAP